MNIIFSVVGGALLYEVCKVQRMIARHEKCSKSMEQMQDTIKKCSECSQALNDLSHTCCQINCFVPDSFQNDTINSSKSATLNTNDLLFKSCELENSSELNEPSFDPGVSTNQTKADESKCPSSPTGKITRNPFFNYVREQRPKRCGQQQKIIIKESAFKWKQLSDEDKFGYTYCAVQMREKLNNKDHKIISNTLNKTK